MENFMEQREILVKSTLDDTMQPSLFYKASGEEKRPLLVGLHTWSFNRFNQIENMLPFAEENNFNLLLPEFRGANLEGNPDCKKACGSEFAVQDVVDAINYVIENENADKDNVFLLGASGGGMMALLLAGKHPKDYKAVGAFVPVCDLVEWQSHGYGKHIVACCGTEEEMLKRSPISYAEGIAKSNTKIFHGKHDPFVPRAHSIELYKKIMAENPDASVYIDIFDGKHEMDMVLATHWILQQYNKKTNVKVTT